MTNSSPATPWIERAHLPAPRPIGPAFSSWLDALRWGAALLVCISHVRSVVLADYAGGGSVPLRAFFWVHGFGHQAVVVFFVLSGYLIGGEVLRGLQREAFSWRTYVVRRVSRLYAVYAAALVLGALWDNLGYRVFNPHQLYNFPGQAFPMVYYPIADRLDAATFLGNLAFLQTIVVPTFGSNTPLWSLANEAWYYALFPLLLWPLFSGAPVARRVTALALFAAGAWFVRGPLLLYFSIWLLGLVPHFLARRVLPPAWPCAGLLAALTVIRARWLPEVGVYAEDLVLGLLLMLLLNGLEFSARPAPGPAALHQRLAAFSYSLYLVHWPFALVLSATMESLCQYGYRLPWSASAAAYYAATLAVVYCFAWFVSQATERHTAALRTRLLALFPVRTPQPVAP